MPFFTYQQYSVEFFLQGNGPLPVVLVHGFGEDETVFASLKSTLDESKYTVLSYHLPGVGGSSHNPSLATIASQAQLLRHLLAEVGMPKAVVLGHSLGGYIALAFAQLFPEMLLGLGLIHSTSFADAEEKILIRTKGIQLMENFGGAAFVGTTLPNLFAPEHKVLHKQTIEKMEQAAQAFSTEALQLQYLAMRERPDTSHILASLHVPVLIVAGVYDVAVPYQHSLAQAKLPNICYFTLLQNVGHMSMIEAPEKLQQSVCHYLSNL
ncbi:MAG: alpha/beta hydrolase [Bacteroidetes bacterium]|nr:MAG: alpha/beta hydrolase [Bacteroidota bacterium]TAF91393.1 MAG: alpha/beta hydrolase [Bacteroidota bacterium]